MISLLDTIFIILSLLLLFLLLILIFCVIFYYFQTTTTTTTKTFNYINIYAILEHRPSLSSFFVLLYIYLCYIMSFAVFFVSLLLPFNCEKELNTATHFFFYNQSRLRSNQFSQYLAIFAPRILLLLLLCNSRCLFDASLHLSFIFNLKYIISITYNISITKRLHL